MAENAFTADWHARHLAKLDGSKQKIKATEAPESRSKYGNQRIEADGKRFDSKKEARIWLELKARQMAGEITDLQHHAPLYHLMAPSPDRQIMVTVSMYEPDFTYLEHGADRRTVVDAKGHRTREYLLKKKWLLLQDAIEILEV